jgi:hypothetical protein
MKNLWKKITGVSLGAVMALGVGVSVILNQGELEAKATDVTDNISIKGFAGSTTSGYVTTETADITTLAYGLKANNYNPGNGQIRGNKTGLVNFYLGNTAAKGDNYYIKSVTLNVTSGTITTSTSARSMCEFGTAEIVTTTLPTGGQAADTSGTGQTAVTWTVANAATANNKFFCIYNLQTSGTVLAAGTNAVEVVYGESGTTSDVVTLLNVTHSASTYTADDVIAAPTTVTATINDVPAQTYTNYRAEVGSLSGETFTKRADVTFGTTTVLAADNLIRFYAKDASTSGGTDFVHADAAITVTAPVLTALTMSAATLSLAKGTSETLTVTPTPELADASVTWTTSDSSIATVVDGVVTAGTTVGEATITARSTTVSTITATCAVSVIEAKTYNLITNVSQLVNNAVIVIAGYDSTSTKYYSMEDYVSGNNLKGVETVVSSGVLTAKSVTTEVTVGVVDGGYTFKVPAGYLYAASTSGNYMKASAERQTDSTDIWTVTITDGVFSVVNVGNTSRGVMQLNDSSTSNVLFACYATATQKPIQLYIKAGVTPTPAEEAAAYAAAFLTATDNCVANAATAWAAQKSAYQELSADAQAVLTNATYSGDYAAATDTQKCVWRYDLAVSKQSLENFMSRAALVVNPASNVEGIVKANSTKTSIIIIAVVGAIGLTAIVGYYFISKKSKHEND